jgi:small subunit ribosomal protein S2
MSGNRWIGGTLTNWSTISTHASQFGHIASMFQDFVNRFRVTSPRYKKMKDAFPGFLAVKSQKDLKQISGYTKPHLKFRQRPDLLIVCRPQENFLLLREAFRLQIPVLAFVDSNASLDYITLPIPVNTDNHEWMYYSLDLLSRLTQKLKVVD